MWTKGPSFPNDKPDATEKANPIAFVKRVLAPRYPWMTKPLMGEVNKQKSQRCVIAYLTKLS
jgi:hypothetical protein